MATACVTNYHSMERIFAKSSNYFAAVNHIFLPKKLPDKESTELIEQESCLLQLISDTILELEYVPDNTKKLIQTMCDIECTAQLDTNKISEAICR